MNYHNLIKKGNFVTRLKMGVETHARGLSNASPREESIRDAREALKPSVAVRAEALSSAGEHPITPLRMVVETQTRRRLKTLLQAEFKNPFTLTRVPLWTGRGRMTPAFA